MNSFATAGKIFSRFLFVMITKIPYVTGLNLSLNSLAKMLGFNEPDKTELNGELHFTWNETKTYGANDKTNEGS